MITWQFPHVLPVLYLLYQASPAIASPELSIFKSINSYWLLCEQKNDFSFVLLKVNSEESYFMLQAWTPFVIFKVQY
jgi:hypothetical protein